MSTFSPHPAPPGSRHLAALVVGIVSLALAAAGGWFNPERFFESYLWAFIYWWLISMGCLGLRLIHEMTGGAWGAVSRPFLNAAVRTLPLVALAFVPLALNLHHIYDWTASGYFDGRLHAENRQWYLTTPFFLWRAASYFAISLVLSFFLTLSRRGRTIDEAPRFQPRLGAVGTVLMVLVVTFAAIDWVMSLEPDWFSTIYGGLFIVGGLLSAMSVVTAGAALDMRQWLSASEPALSVLHDLGKLLLAMLMLWAYFAFSQFLIIYSGNLPVEAVWYTRRTSGGWQYVALLLILLHFALPFGLLLSREAKRNPSVLAGIASGIALVRGLDVYWLVMPSMRDDGFGAHWIDPLVFIGLGGMWMFAYLRSLSRRIDTERWPEYYASPSGGAARA
jgi:hypothetical protein